VHVTPLGALHGDLSYVDTLVCILRTSEQGMIIPETTVHNKTDGERSMGRSCTLDSQRHKITSPMDETNMSTDRLDITIDKHKIVLYDANTKVHVVDTLQTCVLHILSLSDNNML
jgi:hypothetical protein